MAVKTFNTRIKLKTDVADSWSSSSLLLLPGELAIDSTNLNFKIGDGSHVFSELQYVIGGAKLAGWTSDTTTTGNISASDELNTALHKLENKVNAATTGGITGIDMNGAHVTVTSNVADLGNQVTTFGGQNGAITLGNGLEMGSGNDAKQLSAKVVEANGLSLGSTGIAMALADGSNNGAMSSSDFTKLAGIATGAQVNVLEGVQVNGSDLTIDANKKVNVTVAEGTDNGTIKVNGSDVAVHGLGSAAYADTTAFEAAFTDGSHNVATMGAHTPGTGEIATQKIEFKNGTQTSGTLGTGSVAETLYFKSAVTAANPIVTNSDLSGIVGAMVYKGVVDGTHALPTTGVQPGWTYVVAADGTYAGVACETGDMIIAKDDTPSWNVISGENQVTNSQATITAGDGNYTTIATVDGETITAKVSVTGSAGETIASVSNGVVTLSKTITQSTGAGTIGIDSASTNQITLAKVATTGDAEDITVDSANYGGTSAVTTAQAALDNLATAVGNVNTAIADLDATVDAEVDTAAGTTVDTTSTTPTGDFKVLKSVTQTDGELTAGTAYNLKKVAATGAAEDVSLADTGSNYTATTVEGAFTEIATWELILDCGNATNVSVHTA